MGRKKLYATDEERKAARAKYDEKYYRRNRKKILKKQKKRHMERLALQEAGSSSKQTRNVAPPADTTPATKRISKASRQLLIIDNYISQWRNIIGPSAKKYCVGMYMAALKMDSATAFKLLSDTHTELEDVQSKIESALNNILEASGTNCQEYRKGVKIMEPVKDCVSAMFDLWEAAAEDEDEFPAPMTRIFARGGFRFQKWE